MFRILQMFELKFRVVLKPGMPETRKADRKSTHKTTQKDTGTQANNNIFITAFLIQHF